MREKIISRDTVDYGTQIKISDLQGKVSDKLLKRAYAIDKYHSKGKDKNDGYLSTQEINLFVKDIQNSGDEFRNCTADEVVQVFGMAPAESKSKWLNPDSWIVNNCWKNNPNDNKFQSYLNPLYSYTKPGDQEMATQKWIDPLLTTLDANWGNGTNFKRLNSVATIASDQFTNREKAYSFVDPSLSCATSFIKDEKTKNTLSWLNPVAKGGSLLFSDEKKTE